jgi:hypothetical protein
LAAELILVEASGAISRVAEFAASAKEAGQTKRASLDCAVTVFELAECVALLGHATHPDLDDSITHHLLGDQTFLRSGTSRAANHVAVAGIRSSIGKRADVDDDFGLHVRWHIHNRKVFLHVGCGVFSNIGAGIVARIGLGAGVFTRIGTLIDFDTGIANIVYI